MIYLTPADVISRWTGDDAPDLTDGVLATLTEDALALADYMFPTLSERVVKNEPPLRVVQMVLSGVIQRAFQTQNNGLTSFSYSSGPFSESGSFGGDHSEKGSIYFTTKEKETLSGKETSRAFKINLDVHPSGAGGAYPYANYGWPYLPGEV